MYARTKSLQDTCLRLLKTIILALIPGYLQSNYDGSKKLKTLKETHSILPALDGLRGYASFIVLVFHGVSAYSPVIYYGYGAGPANHWIHQLPFLRLIYSGSTMVLVFYIISGYLLSLKPLTLIRAGKWDQAFHTLSSSLFRRGMRLFMPAIVSTFITMVLVYVGFFEYLNQKSVENSGSRFKRFQLPATRMDTLAEQFRDWGAAALAMMNPFTWERFYNPYNAHLWTMSVELRGSFALFLAILGLARLVMPVRMLILCWLMWSFAFCKKWEVALFLSGTFLAEIDLLCGKYKAGKEKVVHRRLGKRKWVARGKILTFIAGLYLVSYPKISGDQALGFQILSNLAPHGLEPDKWWQSIGGMMLVWSVNNIPDVQPIFTNPFAQYLGKISCAIYIVHGPILHTIGLLMITSSWTFTGMSTPAQKSLNFAVSAAVVLPIVFWLADIFWRWVDVPCAKLSRWIEMKLLSSAAVSSLAR